nr:unnamed protein product [Callosobruchus chinensis]
MLAQLIFGLRMEMRKNLPWLVVTGNAIDHTMAISDEDRFSKIAAAESLSIDVSTQAFSQFDHLFIHAMFLICK